MRLLYEVRCAACEAVFAFAEALRPADYRASYMQMAEGVAHAAYRDGIGAATDLLKPRGTRVSATDDCHNSYGEKYE